MLKLPDAAITSIDCANVELTCRALSRCREYISFGDAVLVTSKDIYPPDGIRIHKIKHYNTKQENIDLMLKSLGDFTKSPFVINIHWDGYIINPQCWTDEFYDYDLIGARWPWHPNGSSVGNSGFSMRSRKLLDILASDAFPIPDPPVNDDEYICRTMRPRLEKEFGIKFAPESLADRFSYERGIPNQRTLGFHGLFNFWRHVIDEEMIAIIPNMADYIITGTEYAELLFIYNSMRKFSVMKALYARLKEKLTTPVADHLNKMFQNMPACMSIIECCERL